MSLVLTSGHNGRLAFVEFENQCLSHRQTTRPRCAATASVRFKHLTELDCCGGVM